uniref:RING-type domain-containing protein n=1 Tax=Leersia perrieri TaxID=77586 RepID=A0A0D9VVG4_9ORYZ
MWSFASNAWGSGLRRKSPPNGTLSNADCSDDEASSCTSREEGLECPICWESFNIVENVPYVLWCGHTMCKNCILGLQWAIIKVPTVPIQLPFFISCPWCNLLSLRIIYKGNLAFPRKNYFLLWMVEGMNGERARSCSTIHSEQQTTWLSSGSRGSGNEGFSNPVRRPLAPPVETSSPSVNHANHGVPLLNAERVQASLRKLLSFLVHLTAKFPLVFIFLLIVLYAIPASAAVLLLYILITVLFALPSFLILYFAYPSLDWLVREIFA